MQTSFSAEFLQTTDGQRVNDILRNCVHCGFCNATCPTYQITGNELDSPRGRIYLIKNFFENQATDQHKSSSDVVGLKHLDRCLTCLACETTCPSGVNYGELVDIGRKHINHSCQRGYLQKLKRKLIIFLFSHSRRASVAFGLARLLKPLLPSSFAKKVPPKQPSIQVNIHSFSKRKILALKGCVQSSAAPQINSVATKILNKSDIELNETESECCGALAFHLTDLDKAHQTIRNNIDDWHEKLSNNHEYLLVTSSGCSSFIKQYATIMHADDLYANKAKFISERCKDLTEFIPEIKPITKKTQVKTVAFHSPCTLQHGQKITGVIENKLEQAGYTLLDSKDSHLCCGSAGSYSLLEGDLSNELLRHKIASLEENSPDIIATANIGCLMHLQSGTDTPVKHWIELLD